MSLISTGSISLDSTFKDLDADQGPKNIRICNMGIREIHSIIDSSRVTIFMIFSCHNLFKHQQAARDGWLDVAIDASICQ